MSRIELRGLRANLPIGAMAAFGCLRICQRLPEFRESKLAWESGGGADFAVLVTPRESSPAALVSALLEDVKGAAERHELTWRDQIKTASSGEFRAETQKALQAATAQNREAADWFAAFGSELENGKDGKIESTPFDMSVARQRFLADAAKLARGLADDGFDSYNEALFGPWKYKDDQHSLGWDPTTIKLGAFTYKAPTAMANSGVRAAVWLAFESVPLFPCFYSSGLQVRAFVRSRREYAFYWPIWRAPIGLEVLGSLLGVTPPTVEEGPAELAAQGVTAVYKPLRLDPRIRHRAELAARGVTAVYRSERFKPNKYLFSFRTPELVFAGAVAAVA